MATAKRRAAETGTGAAAPPGDLYFNLVKRWPLRPLRSEADLDAATAMIHSLLDGDGLAGDEDDYLDVLAGLVEKYEADHHPIADVSGIEMLRFLIENRDATQGKVAQGAGVAPSTLSAILRGGRRLSIDHLTAFAAYFGVQPAVFLPTPKPR